MKRKKVRAEEEPQQVKLSPRMLVLYHSPDRWQHALMWMEHRGTSTVPMRPYAMHVLYRDDVTVMYDKRPASDAAYVAPTSVRTTAKEFEAYLRDRLRQFGGHRDAYLFLGVDRPAPTITEPSAEVQTSLTELYTRAAKAMETTVEDLVSRYGRLNPGLQAMNLRNRLRARGKAV